MDVVRNGISTYLIQLIGVCLIVSNQRQLAKSKHKMSSALSGIYEELNMFCSPLTPRRTLWQSSELGIHLGVLYYTMGKVYDIVQYPERVSARILITVYSSLQLKASLQAETDQTAQQCKTGLITSNVYFCS